MENTNQYRFDDSVKRVFKLNFEENAYVHYCSYMSCGIDDQDSEEEMIQKVENSFQE